MKKKLALFVALAMMTTTALYGCGNNTGQDTETTEEESEDTGEGEETEEREVVMHTEADAYVSGINLKDYVTLGEYDGLHLTKEKIEITEAEIDDELSYYESFLPYEPIDKETVEEGDIINVDYEGKLKSSGEVFDGGTATGSDIETANGGFIDGFLEGIYGHDVGETFDIECTFPEDYGNEDLNGQDVIFTITVNAIEEAATLSDDNASSLATYIGVEEEEINSVKDIREHIREDLEESAESSAEAALENQVVEALIDVCDFKEPPEAMIARYEGLLNNSLEQQVMMYALYYGQEMTADDLLTETREAEGFEGTNEEYLRSLAIDQCNSLMALCAVAEDQGIEIPREQIDAAVQSTLENNSYETEQDYTDANGTLLSDMVFESLTAQAALEYLMREADIEEVEPQDTEEDADEEETDDAGEEEDADDADADAAGDDDADSADADTGEEEDGTDED